MEILYSDVALTVADTQDPVVRDIKKKKSRDAWISGKSTAETHVTLSCRKNDT